MWKRKKKGEKEGKKKKEQGREKEIEEVSFLFSSFLRSKNFLKRGYREKEE